MTPKANRRLWNVVRIGLCVAALAFVIQGVTLEDRVTLQSGEVLSGAVRERTDAGVYEVTVADGSVRAVREEDVAVDEQGLPRIAFGFKSAWRQSHRGLLVLCVVIFLPVVFLLGFRLRLLLAAQNIPLGLFAAIKLSFAGNFLNFAAPLGSNAGDVFKAYFVSLHTARRTEAATTVFLDRAIGLGTLLLVVAALTTFAPRGSSLAVLKPYLLTLITLGGAAIVAYLSPGVRRWAVPRKLLARLPGYEHLRRIDSTARELAKRPGIVLGAVGYTLMLQVIAMGAYIVVAKALGLRVELRHVPEYYAYFATGAVVQALPGPPQGLGTVELAYRVLFGPFGSASQIVCMALGIRLMTLLCALPGAFVVLTGGYRPRPAPATEMSPPPEPSGTPMPELACEASMPPSPGPAVSPAPARELR
ncbi:MAG TPA: lysylphosphatidylglycerol synthase domain-containing protein [Phycisphaerae bacterium]|nr:lysylphosphatidylglycerol synthase domain-containing protein [Phycisphaerae bacterium]HNU45001.1 lysylphosphatidylglycerol synthase domain-containing protein [Phycisphaerae bacterium]